VTPAPARAAPRLVPLEAGHLARLRLQPSQAALGPHLANPALAGAWLRSGPAWSVLLEGEPVAAGGLIRSMGPPLIAWALLSPAAGPHLLRLSRAARRWLALEPCEAAIADGDARAARFARLCGLRPTGGRHARWGAGEGFARWVGPGVADA
jgi:hypothetical protein